MVIYLASPSFLILRTYPSEIFSANVRGKAVSFATATNWAFNFALAYAVPPMLNHIKYKTYFVFACFNAVAAIHMFFAAHETKRRTLEEMDDVFDSGLPPWKTSKVTSSRLEQLAEEIARGIKGGRLRWPISSLLLRLRLRLF
jgi:Sugar (and other) transporter